VALYPRSLLAELFVGRLEGTVIWHGGNVSKYSPAQQSLG
jgi:hypothetical protein